MHNLDIIYKIKCRTKTRMVNLLVSEEKLHNQTNLEYDNWKFSIPYAFREALDLRYEQRTKNKKKYMVWTQGPCLRFKEGDILHSKCGSFALQIRYALPMGWDEEKDLMYEGTVLFDVFEINNGKYSKQFSHQVTQLEYLKILVYGHTSINSKSSSDDSQQFSLALDL